MNIYIGLCKYEECPKSKECVRFIHNLGEEFLFQNICNEENKYQWFMKGDVKIEST